MSEPALFSVSVKALICQDDFLLLLQRHSFAGDLFWDLPGGRLDTAELAFDRALARELAEEIGYQGGVRIAGIGGISTWNEPDSGYAPKLSVVFHAKLDPRLTEIVLSDEHAGYSWVPVGKLPSDDGCRIEPDFATLIGASLA